MDRYLRWAEPWGGCLIPEDTGLCNRLLHWEIAFHISQENDFAFKILVEQPFWAELSYLDIPITEGIEKRHMRDSNYVYDPATFIKGAKPITLDMVDWMFRNQDWKLSRDNDWYCDFGFNHIDEVTKFAKKTPTKNWWYPKIWREEFRPLKLIEFKNKNFQKLIERKMKGVVGIHLRRHPNGVFRDVDDKYLLRNGEPIDWEAPKANGEIFADEEGYIGINNSFYFDIMDNMLKINSQQKFYISSDVPIKYVSEFYERYDVINADNIVKNSPVMRREAEMIPAFGDKDFHKHCRKNVIDLMCLSNSSFLLTFGQSTWSQFAQTYKNIPHIDPKYKWNVIAEKNYKDYLWRSKMDKYRVWPLGVPKKELLRPELEQIKEIGYEWDDPMNVVEQFEKKIAEYAGSKYAVAVDSCSNAIYLCLKYLYIMREDDDFIQKKIQLPKNTWCSVPMMILQSGFDFEFIDKKWKGVYQLEPFNIVDGAGRFTRDMYEKGMFHCLSFQMKKRLPIGKGGAILMDDKLEYDWFKRASNNGRHLDVPYVDDELDMVAWNMYMTPEDAARGLLLFEHIDDVNEDSHTHEHYTDLSKQRVFYDKK